MFASQGALARGRSGRIRLHGRQFIATRFDEMEAPTARETEDGFADPRTGGVYRCKRRFQILDLDDRKWRRSRFLWVGLEPKIHIASQGTGVGWPKAGHLHGKNFVEKGLAGREVLRWQLDEIGSVHGLFP